MDTEKIKDVGAFSFALGLYGLGCLVQLFLLAAIGGIAASILSCLGLW